MGHHPVVYLLALPLQIVGMRHAFDDVLVLAEHDACGNADEPLAPFADELQHIFKVLAAVAFHHLFGAAAVHHAGNMRKKAVITLFHRRGEIRLFHHAHLLRTAAQGIIIGSKPPRPERQAGTFLLSAPPRGAAAASGKNT